MVDRGAQPLGGRACGEISASDERVQEIKIQRLIDVGRKCDRRSRRLPGQGLVTDAGSVQELASVVVQLLEEFRREVEDERGVSGSVGRPGDGVGGRCARRIASGQEMEQESAGVTVTLGDPREGPRLRAEVEPCLSRQDLGVVQAATARVVDGAAAVVQVVGELREGVEDTLSAIGLQLLEHVCKRAAGESGADEVGDAGEPRPAADDEKTSG